MNNSKVHMVTRLIALSVIPLAVGLLSACGTPGGTAAVAVQPSVSATEPSQPASLDTPIMPTGPQSGTFADLPTLTTYLTERTAIDRARQAGATSAPTSANAPAFSQVASYSKFLTLIGATDGGQLAPDNTVVMVTVQAPYKAEVPRPAGATANTWPQYSVAFDARTGYTLYLGPATLAS